MAPTGLWLETSSELTLWETLRGVLDSTTTLVITTLCTLISFSGTVLEISDLGSVLIPFNRNENNVYLKPAT